MSTWAPGQRVWVNRHTRIVHDAPEYNKTACGIYIPEPSTQARALRELRDRSGALSLCGECFSARFGRDVA